MIIQNQVGDGRGFQSLGGNATGLVERTTGAMSATRFSFGRKPSVAQACQALWYLNRDYCKDARCNPVTKATIYKSLKPPMVRWLYENGHCMYANKSVRDVPCRDCNGDAGRQARCRSCNGTGVYCSYTQFYFRFAVEGLVYSWHLPGDQVGFPFSTSFQQAIQVRGEPRLALTRTFPLKVAIKTLRSFLEANGQLKASKQVVELVARLKES